MSLYNISGGKLAETKISDFLVGDLLEGRSSKEEALGTQIEETVEIEDFEEKKDFFVDFLNYKKAEVYSRKELGESIIKEEISLDDPVFDEDEVCTVLEQALTMEKLPKFELKTEEEEMIPEELEDIDLSDLESLSDEERATIENASRIAEIRKILDEMIFHKKNEAKIILDTAEEEAVLIRKTAEYAAEKIKEDAYSEAKTKGYSDGYQEGMTDAQKTIASAIEKETFKLKQEVEAVISSVSEAKNAIINNFIDELRDLAVSTAEKVVKISLESSGEVIKGMILSSVEELQKTQWLKIYISRFDFELLKETDYDLLDALSSVSEDVKIVVMEEEPLGTAIVETPQQVIDLSVSSQMNNIKEIIENAL